MSLMKEIRERPHLVFWFVCLCLTCGGLEHAPLWSQLGATGLGIMGLALVAHMDEHVEAIKRNALLESKTPVPEDSPNSTDQA